MILGAAAGICDLEANCHQLTEDARAESWKYWVIGDINEATLEPPYTQNSCGIINTLIVQAVVI